ncbi:MAG: Type II secretory pathway, pullulanase PulA and related glycosidase [Clostridiales bacterium]|nr:Type II secretory pathway, pullulanase PulA and related glycosidase [Clostridiales bacterium]
MRTERKPWGIRQGDPTKPGTARTADGYNFALHTTSDEPVELIFYRKGSGEPEQKIVIPDEYRTGNMISLVIMKQRLSLYEYVYRQGGKTFPDPNGRVVCQKGIFGEKNQEKQQEIRSSVLNEAPIMPCSPYIPYEDMVVYKVHVRGYTMQKNSKVRKKGTFQGLQEKISYWKELGITSVELMPAYDFLEYPEKKEKPSKYQPPETSPGRLNYWGYTKGNYFAPKPSYCQGKQAEQEVKAFISALHKEGMECLMDFCFPAEIGPELVVEALRFWRMEYGVDGFMLYGDGVWMELIARDEVLADAKLICPGCDMDRLYRFQEKKTRRLGEANEGFQNAARRFLKGDEDQINGFLYHNKRNPASHGVLHYMANHDGFTLADLVSYDSRHNEENGEENRDGSKNNYSWNCGTEGPTRKISIQELRKRQMRNAMMMLMLSQGTPLIYGGDELGNSQNGNNNAYCQDNETGWVDWSQSRKFAGFTGFVRNLIQFRSEHPILHMPYELCATDYKSLGWPELSYHSERAWFSNTESSSRHTGILYCGKYAEKEDGTADDFIYVIYNMHWNQRKFALPDLPEGMSWYAAVDSGRKPEEAVCPAGQEKKISEKKSLTVDERTILVLIGKQG